MSQVPDIDVWLRETRENRIVLAAADADALVTAISDPPAPSHALVDLMRLRTHLPPLRRPLPLRPDMPERRARG